LEPGLCCRLPVAFRLLGGLACMLLWMVRVKVKVRMRVRMERSILRQGERVVV
jgi:hypothetical protein